MTPQPSRLVGDSAADGCRAPPARLRAGDEAAFEALVEPPLRARCCAVAQHATCATAAVAEEVVQETWLAVLQGLDRFEGRSSLKTWILSHPRQQGEVARRARGAQRAVRLARAPRATSPPSTPSASAAAATLPGALARVPARLERSADDAAAGPRDAAGRDRRAIAALPPAQQRRDPMRDVEGFSAEEVCAALDVSEGNQRVLLHRARSRVRAALEGTSNVRALPACRRHRESPARRSSSS